MTRTAKVQMPETPYSNSWQVELTAEQIDTLMLRLQVARKALEEPLPTFRVGDYGYSPHNGFWLVRKEESTPEIVYDHGSGCCIMIYERERQNHQRLGNLFNLLKDGPILVGLTEEEAALRFEAGPSRQEKIRVALDRYRAAQKKDEP